ncbi:MAG: mechanosensitive ion channel family protein [Planctomycetota bacterium]|nr:MAG: mechanosensitive ion channel family protein [Planctomycetota bacterium]
MKIFLRFALLLIMGSTVCATSAAAQSSGGAGQAVSDMAAIWQWLALRGTAILVTVVLGVVVWLVLKKLLDRLFQRTRMVPAFAIFVQRGLRWAMILIITLAVIQQAGVELGLLWGMLSAGVAMVAIGFVAVWSMLSNCTAAFILLMSRPFRIGDTVEITEATGGAALKGVLVDISLMYTSIEERRDDGEVQMVRIPNNVVLQKTIRVVPSRDGVDLGEHLSEQMMQQGRSEEEALPGPSSGGD